LIVKVANNQEITDGICVIEFSDDDMNKKSGSIIFNIDTRKPRCNLSIETDICSKDSVSLKLS
jgi:hypothetical protein